jgi:hypothetical protein
MRTYGRVKQPDGTYKWYEVSTPASGDNSLIWLITFCQVLKLFLNESPFWGNYGLPAKQDVLQQIFPGAYVTQTQRQFAQHFASLIVYQQPDPEPHYVVNITTLSGEKVQVNMGVPQ